jgi:molybdenum cofactor cytidylyltransferase
MAETVSCALILLAAGASTRMGRPKQLLPVGGEPLLRRVAQVALLAPVSPVIVVLGAQAAAVTASLAGLDLHIVVNEQWQDGMGTSLNAGLNALASLAPGAGRVIIALGDQADFSVAHVNRLIEAQRQTGQPIVASSYRETLMPPALFTSPYFPELSVLTGDTGARTLFKTHAAQVTAVPLTTHADLDSPEDYSRYTGNLLLP